MSPAPHWEDIAIVGTACRVAGADSPAELGANVLDGRCDVTEVSSERWDPDDFHSNGPVAGRGVSRWSGQLADPYAFDAGFFRIGGVEAAHMDPQQRVVLEESWHCVEESGIAVEELRRGSTGVFLGVCSRDHLQNQVPFEEITDRTTFGGSDYMIANRVSHFLGLDGASYSVDAACSSSLLTLHLGVRSLQAHESDFALVGGVNLNLHPWKFVSYSHARMLSPTGRCHAFDRAADGFVSGDGVAVLLLRRLDDALAAGDHIHGCVVGSAVNSAGPRRSLTAPTVSAQTDLIRSALAAGSVDPAGVQYVETHGTGTPIGDPIEVEAVRAVYGAAARAPVHLGSVKANVGHTEGAAGAVGVVKVLETMRAGTIPPSAELADRNPLLRLDDTMRVPSEPVPWTTAAPGEPRRAAVSAFGAGGSNAHVVIEEPPRQTADVSPPWEPEAVPVLVSAATGPALDALRDAMADALDTASLSDAAYTLATGRSALAHRVGGVASTADEVREALAGEPPRRHERWLLRVGAADLSDADTAETAREHASRLDVWAVDSGHVADVAAAYRAGADTPGTRCLHTMLVLAVVTEHVRVDAFVPIGEGWWPVAHAAGMLSAADALLAAEDPDRGAPHVPPTVPVVADTGWPWLRPDLLTWDELRTLLDRVDVTDARVERAVAEALDLEGDIPMVGRGLAAWWAALAEHGAGEAGYAPPEEGTGRRRRAMEALACASVMDRLSTRAGISAPLGDADDDFAALVRAVTLCDLDAADVVRAIMAPGDADSAPVPLSRDADTTPLAAVRRMRAQAAADTPASVFGTLARSGCGTELACAPLEGDIGDGSVTLPWTASRARFLPALVDLWSRGAEVDWKHWFGPRPRRRASLPTYPFQRAIHRVGGPVAVSASAAPTTYELVETWSDVPRSAAPGTRPALVVAAEDASAGVWTDTETDPRRLTHRPGTDFDRAAGRGDLRTFDAWTALLADVAHTGVGVDAVVLVAGPDDRTGETDTHWSVTAALGVARAAMRLGVEHPLRIVQLVLPGAEGAAVEAARALGPALAAESTTVSFSTVDVHDEMSGPELAELVRSVVAAPPHPVLRAGRDRCVRLGYRSVPARLRKRWDLRPGLHIVAGGGGGLGQQYARALLAVPGVTVALLGRAERGPTDLMAKYGDRLRYLSCDITDSEGVRAAVAAAVDVAGEVRGLVHAAGVLDDAFVRNLDERRLRDVLAPKICGVHNLDEATADQPLDHFLLCSSLAVTFGNPGQAGYAVANAYLDAAARERNRMRDAGLRSGVCASVQWGWWADGGMHLDPAHRLVATGALAPMPSADGLAVTAGALADGRENVVVVHGDRSREHLVTAAFTTAEPDPGDAMPAVGSARPTESEEPAADEAARDYVRTALADILGTSAADMDLECGIETHGVDSIHVLRFSQMLEADLGCQEPALLFESRTLEAAARRLAARHGEALTTWARGSSGEAAEAAEAEPTMDRIVDGRVADGAADGAEEPADARDAIAVVGMAGRYPGAADLDAFWDVLRRGEVHITDIPRDRWGADPHRGSANSCPRGGFLSGIDHFDPLFFGISTTDAITMDPQERLFLQTAWHAFEDAGIPTSSLGDPDDPDQRRVGVFVGVTTATNSMFGPEYWRRGEDVFPTSMPWAIANRVSHAFDLRGPSIAVDTACASSLNAVHLAVRGLRAGECAAALVGGVNLYLHPWKYAYLGHKQMVSPTGVCSAFGAAADGFVPGEGVGALLLKPLADATRDGDRVLGLIRGTAVNHGGRARGFTVPRPSAQSAVVGAAVRDAGVDPNSLGYVEAHGTGTRLGDPVEISGLAEALGTLPGHRLPVGSVKSQIGHLEAAAGIAGLTKVLLQLRHRTLVPSLHAEPPNPVLDLDAVGIEVVSETRRWQVDSGAEGPPRRAGVSSFGAGGSNAHVVVEEYGAGAVRVEPGDLPGPHAFCVSAAAREQLDEVCAGLARWAAQHSGTPPAVLAHHLQVRRDALAHRVVVVADTLDRLIDVLHARARGEAPVDLVVGRRASQVRGAAARAAAAAGPHADVRTLARLWADGAIVDWSARWPAGLPHLDLPLYPFARHRIALSEPGASDGAGDPGMDGAETGERQGDGGRLARWRRARVRAVELDAAETVLDHHRVHGTPVLPAVAVIELVLAAAEECGLNPSGLRRLVMSEPIAVADRLSLLVEFTDDARFTVTSPGTPGRTTHAQGRLLTESVEGMAADLAGVRERCAEQVDPARVYGTLGSRGLELGGPYRGLAELALGEGEVVARVVRPPDDDRSPGATALDPAVFDSCLQPSVLIAGGDALRLPFEIGRCEVLGPLPDEVHSHLWRTRSVHGATCFDVDVRGPDGGLLVRLRDFWVRDSPASRGGAAGADMAGPVATAPVAGAVPGPADDRIALLAPSWSAVTGTARRADARLIVVTDDELLGRDLVRGADGSHSGVLALANWTSEPVESERALAEAVDGPGGDPVDVVLLTGRGGSSDPSSEPVANAVLAALRRLVHSETSAARLLCVYAGDDTPPPAIGALAGLLTTANTELDRCTGAVLHVVAGDSVPAAVRRLRDLESWDHAEYRVAGGTLLVPTWEQRAVPEGRPPLRTGGVHLVTGGNGGLGRRLVEHLVRQYEATVVVASRSGTDLELAVDVRPSVRFVRADVTTKAGAEAAVAATRRVRGRLDGIFHCAAVLRDEYVLAATEEAVGAVLAPKVRGALHLDRATAEDEPGVFCVFSSVAGQVANPGQAVYAYANSWLDRFAARRAERSGTTLSLLVPYVADGGMAMPDEQGRQLERRYGLRPVTSAQVLTGLDAALGSGEPVLAVVPPSGVLDQRPEPDRADSGGTVEALTAFLLARVGALSMTDPSQMDADAELAVYGLDSIAFSSLAVEVNDAFGTDISPATFFEYSTVRALAGHFGDSVDVPPRTFPAPAQPQAPETGTLEPDAPRPRPEPAVPAAPTTPAVSTASKPDRDGGPAAEPIAIIGMAGRFPGSADADEFWTHLESGDDLVTEIPKDRWDWQEYYDPDMARENTTNSKWGGFVPGVDEFDHAFFGISPREATLMDPQHRLFLQTAYQTVEDAGYRPSALSRGRTGVFVGVASHDYFELVRGSGRPIEGHSATGMFHSLLPNRVSYLLNLTGPSFPIDAACSSSLVSVHTAVEALRAGSCDTAIAGGVNLLISPTIYIAFSRAGMLSPTGRCRTFDQAADGYVRGEGVAAVLLKPLRRALADGDHIHGVIRGSAVNHGGRVNTLTTPNPNAQAELIRSALAAAGVTADELDYVEMHGTGTPLGDPIEINGLKKALGRSPREHGPGGRSELVVGSVKSVVGHLEAAAGMAGLFKVLLGMRHGALPRNLHLHTLNEHIRLEDSGIRIADTAVHWPAGDRPRLAGISSFGFGGINAHVVVEEGPR
ncbi:SDR family NAD(P)-dependent oxidoreductase [Nocardiopsis sp. JB363]|uniref:SDR family NAD(P)-dependent oxidoreductase n=1 Tax=Nocardiopsis sp. JB363 TaxID=1434837 RepID=UPI00097A9638|nr:SDR family NAD(P)-dependent oxidoreductase [Nocardiopsis sp. JB363]SIO84431.1 Malonyl CoA-acyl carrier protein transacylase [Nocardiopsis sp. JB363]